MSDKIHTAESSRDILGKGAIINPNHGGPLRRPVETLVADRDTRGGDGDDSSQKRRVWVKGDTIHYSIDGVEVTSEQFFKKAD